MLVASAADQVVPILKKHLEQLKQPPRSEARLNILPTTLIAQATSTAPSKPPSEHTTNILTDLFSSIPELEAGTRTAAGQATIHEYLDAKTAKEVIEFWEDEWLV